MSKPFTYWVRLATVATLCTLTTFNPVLAGRCIERLLKRNNCLPAACIEVPACETHCVVTPGCDPVPTCVTPLPCVAAPSMTPCDALPMTPAMPAESTTHEHASPPDTPPTTEPDTVVAPQEPAVVAPPADPAPPVVAPPAIAPAQPTLETPAPVVDTTPAVADPTPAAAIPATPIVPAPAANDPVDALFGDDPVTPAETAKPADIQTLDTAPSTAAPAMPEGEAAPKADPIDDLFGDSAKPTEPVTPTEPAKEPTIDDLFGTESPSPAKDAPAAEPKDSIDDLFGDSTKPTEPAIPTEPAKEPAIDDLFGTEATEPAPAKTEPAPANNESIDDLFGTPDPKPTETDPAKPADSLDDLFGKPVSTDASEAPSADDKYLDSLFQTKPEPAKEAPAQPNPQPTKESAPKKGNADPLDELFGLGEFTPPQQFRGAEFQTWVDNTGTYSVKARLAVIYTDRVKLQKENGKFTTVPLSRLSDRDYAYVQWVASNLSADANAKFVKKDAEGSDTDSIR